MPIKPKLQQTQTGAVLVISLIMLLLLTIIGVNGMRSTSLEERMAGNMRDKALAFESAEAALRDAETFMETVFTLGAFNADGSDGYYNDDLLKIWEEVDWKGTVTGNTNKAVTMTSSIPGVQPGQYVIQYVADSEEEDISGGHNLSNVGQGTGGGSTAIFRITVRGTGSSGSAAVVLQTIYGRKL